MKLLSVFPLLLLSLFLGCAKAPQAPAAKTPSEGTQQEEQYRKEMEEIRRTIKSDIKIKLKRDGKAGTYSWEIDGKDPREVLKANDVISKRLGTQ